MEIDEAIDLIYTLPHGSRFISKIKPEYSWSAEKHSLADIADILYRFLDSSGSTRVTRPADIIARQEAYKKAQETRAKIENTKWEIAE